MVPKKLGVKSAKELNGATVCVQPGTTTELNLADYFRANKMEFKPVVIEKLDEVQHAFFSGRCDVYTTDALGPGRAMPHRPRRKPGRLRDPARAHLEGAAGAGRAPRRRPVADIVRWVVYALIEAEEKGITSKNVDDMVKSDDPTIKRMLGVTPGMGKALGLDEKWAYNVVKPVGNYGEIFDRNVGARLAAQARARPQQSVDARAA